MCPCYFCTNKLPHRHSLPVTMHPISGRLKVAESLDPNDMIKRWACSICGHIIEED